MDAWLLDAVRTPFGRSRGGLSSVRPDDLGAVPVRELLARHPDLDPALVDDVVLGNTNGAGEDNRNVARMASLLAGLPTSVPGVTVNRLCGSGAEAIVQAARAVRGGDAGLVVAGGVESMSRAPFVLAPVDTALPREATLHATTVGWRMTNPLFPAPWVESLGRSAELVAERLGIGREEQDAWAARSHERAQAAWDRGHHDGFVVPVAGVDRDESIRPGTTTATLAALRPAFSDHGAVTAGNSSPINDGAVATLVGTREHAVRLGLTPLARVVGSAAVGVDPAEFALAPVVAVRALLSRLGRRLEDVDLLELNEAFAAVVLSCLTELPVPQESVNPDGGAIALGHPLGASAARAVVDLARGLRRRGGEFGIATACMGVGQGIAVALEVSP
jgi:acetyl-CoA acetyltransferase family protein